MVNDRQPDPTTGAAPARRPGAAALGVTVIGCSGSYPGPANPASSYLLRTRTTTVLLDAGSGSLTNLQRHVDLRSLDAVVLSHAHPDHWIDLTGLRVALRYYVPRDGLPVVTTAEVMDAATTLAGDDGAPTLVWDLVGDGATRRIGDLDLRFSRTDHPVETLAVRIDHDGRSLAYSADTGPGWSLEALGPDLHLALVEATLDVDQEGVPGHLSGRQAGAMAAAAGAARLVVTHVPPTADPEDHRRDAEAAFGGPTTLAAPDLELFP
ncbi:MAG: MBL fold metallo-hydrolase [Actinobacteria bacterium]|nr:MBL fold metallo-hydrolase [Actinomycetota bacterium]